ncbi:alcohol dehydrogenase/alcohol dehydrogenase, propanol-preferring [Fodinibius roseus]|uniref:Alcohol dehydrogenase/alcohol dehydrogenase, propanol-preferring n=1 Tax=Fodinibius roseus TaxID=1194090 RepID=A0A1M5FY71_9BACT|nr:alcohol dehydrogenase [Fodinibius roseus]SHF96507.1 alcohol dehydrogenase/alcohol dehydrogenase, propanol-preferring [Fodinibius roseus]
MSTMKAMQVPAAGADFEAVEKEIPSPGNDEVLIKVQACGICHSDAFVKEGLMPGIEYPRVPGHEVIGTIEERGDTIDRWEIGQRVGVGWHGGHCYKCESCRNGDFINCENGRVTGIHFDGGYAEYLVAPESALAAIPESLDAAEAAPLLCAGITTFNALRNSRLEPGDTVAVQGIGGLGHLAVQYANKFGCKVVALSRGDGKKELALALGAHQYIDTEANNAAEKLQAMGGAKVILATAPSSEAISSVVDGLGRNGQLMVVAAANDPIEVTPLQLIMGRKSVSGWPSGDARDSEETLHFSALQDITPKIETFPLEQANEAYDRMINNEARFRVVLDMGG